MGRIFEVRKSAMFARWDKMAKNFTRIGKEIAIAVKAGGEILQQTPPYAVVLQMLRHATCQKIGLKPPLNVQWVKT